MVFTNRPVCLTRNVVLSARKNSAVIRPSGQDNGLRDALHEAVTSRATRWTGGGITAPISAVSHARISASKTVVLDRLRDPAQRIVVRLVDQATRIGGTLHPAV